MGTNQHNSPKTKLNMSSFNTIKFVSLTLLWMTSVLPIYSWQSDFVTYDWLTGKVGDGEAIAHIPHWRRLFNTMKVRGLLECGCGYYSGYFLDHADTVISIEYMTRGYGGYWYKICLPLFNDRPNWVPLTYNENFRSNSFNNACAYQCTMHRDYALIDSTYLRELDRHFKIQLNKHEIDVAFVNSTLYIRGDLVKLLLANEVPLIVAHDTLSDHGTEEEENLYGWNKVITPSTYTKIQIPFDSGTTFWISNQLPDVISSIWEYREAILHLREVGVEVGYDELKYIADMTPSRRM